MGVCLSLWGLRVGCGVWNVIVLIPDLCLSISFKSVPSSPPVNLLLTVLKNVVFYCSPFEEKARSIVFAFPLFRPSVAVG